MKAISLWQPWASLIAAGVKPFETRHWPPPASVIGAPIAIHAAKRPPVEDEIHELLALVESGAAGANVAPRALQILYDGLSGGLTLGAILCTARLQAAYCCGQMISSDQVTITAARTRSDRPVVIQADPFGDYSKGRWAWHLTDVSPLPRPVRATGRQGLFTWEPSPIHPGPLFADPSIPSEFPGASNERTVNHDR